MSLDVITSPLLEGLPHGFFGFTPFSAACNTAVDEVCNAVKELLPKIGAGSTTTAEEQPDAIA